MTKRTYTDVNGMVQTITRVGSGYYVAWSDEALKSPSTRWRMEDGSVVQIPDNAWETLNIKYEDSQED